MHPFIRILSLLVLAAFIPWLPGSALLATGLMLSVWGTLRPHTGRAMLRGMRRVRWLLLSLLVLYLWFSPGAPVLPALGAWSPTETGIALAFHRGGILLIMVFAAAAFLSDVPPRELVTALRQLLGWPVQTNIAMRFADRVGLLLTVLPVVEQGVRDSLKRDESGFAERATELFRGIESGAARSDIEPASFPLEPVPHMQWLLPGMLLLTGIAFVFLLPGI